MKHDDGKNLAITTCMVVDNHSCLASEAVILQLRKGQGLQALLGSLLDCMDLQEPANLYNPREEGEHRRASALGD